MTAHDAIVTARTRLRGERIRRSDLRRQLRCTVMRGTFLIELPSVSTVRVLALAGFSFVVLDMEHSAFGVPELVPLLSEARAVGILPIVRVPDGSPATISRVLDTGAAGVMVPQITTADEARAVVAAARFAPQGNRGFSPLTIFDALGTPQLDVNDTTLVIVQVEGR